TDCASAAGRRPPGLLGATKTGSPDVGNVGAGVAGSVVSHA
ncbi:hypothetical protein LCGC14_2159070, partial [marine sediment metagenome]